MKSIPGVLELTHNHGTENDAEFAYHNGNTDPRGFGHICVSVPDVRAACARFEALDVPFQKRLQDGRMNYPPSSRTRTVTGSKSSSRPSSKAKRLSRFARRAGNSRPLAVVYEGNCFTCHSEVRTMQSLHCEYRKHTITASVMPHPDSPCPTPPGA